MRDEEEETEVQNRDVVLPVVPLPTGGTAVVGGQLSAVSGGTSLPGTGFAPFATGTGAFGVVEDAATDRGGGSEIADGVEAALAEDGRVAASHITIAVEDGVVLLSGTVSSERERETAEAICAAVSGVQRVDNRLTVA